jgi:hypothetical protein
VAKIKIVKVPPGFAPKKIRSAWIGGVEIPLVSPEEAKQDPPSGAGVGNDNVDVYLVLRTEAITALRRAGKDKVASYWEGLPLGKYLRFRKNVCEIVS